MLRAAQQGCQRKGFALGLEDTVCTDVACGTDNAIGRTDNGIVGRMNCSRVVLQGTGKEIVERGIGFRCAVKGFCHVDAITANEFPDEQVLQPGSFSIGELACQAGQQVLGYQVLEKDKQAFHQVGQNQGLVRFQSACQAGCPTQTRNRRRRAH